ATGGPAEQTFSTLVGLELRPRRLREAAALWRQLAETRGIEGRDTLWSHPDLLPDAAALDAPEEFLAGHRDEPLHAPELHAPEDEPRHAPEDPPADPRDA
ncbi:MAG: zinc-dependent metalloprotease, partial [Frankia sp.]|nr:zinc-dependent metalloprotease [Frankia sp.]